MSKICSMDFLIFQNISDFTVSLHWDQRQVKQVKRQKQLPLKLIRHTQSMSLLQLLQRIPVTQTQHLTVLQAQPKQGSERYEMHRGVLSLYLSKNHISSSYCIVFITSNDGKISTLSYQRYAGGRNEFPFSERGDWLRTCPWTRTVGHKGRLRATAANAKLMSIRMQPSRCTGLFPSSSVLWEFYWALWVCGFLLMITFLSKGPLRGFHATNWRKTSKYKSKGPTQSLKKKQSIRCRYCIQSPGIASGTRQETARAV